MGGVVEELVRGRRYPNKRLRGHCQPQIFLIQFIDRSCPQRCSLKKGVLRNFAKFWGKHLCQCLFFNKVAGLRPATLLKKRLWHRCFRVNFAKFPRTPFLQNAFGRLLQSRFRIQTIQMFS